MPQSSKANTPLKPNFRPVLVTIEGLTAGYALRDGQRLRFIATNPKFGLLDGSCFTHAEQVKNAAQKLARAARDYAKNDTSKERDPF